MHPDRYQLGEIARLMSLGIVKVHVDQTFPLEQAAKLMSLWAPVMCAAKWCLFLRILRVLWVHMRLSK